MSSVCFQTTALLLKHVRYVGTLVGSTEYGASKAVPFRRREETKAEPVPKKRLYGDMLVSSRQGWWMR